MSTHSQTQTAVLGALSIQPMTGYAVRENIQNVLGHFWSESFGQIYPTLPNSSGMGLSSGRSPSILDLQLLRRRRKA